MKNNKLEKIFGRFYSKSELLEKYKEAGIECVRRFIFLRYTFYGLKISKKTAISIVEYMEKLKTLNLSNEQIKSALYSLKDIIKGIKKEEVIFIPIYH